MKNVDFKMEIRNLTFAKEMYLEELIALFSYESHSMLELNKSRALSDIELMIRTMQELRERITE